MQAFSRGPPQTKTNNNNFNHDKNNIDYSYEATRPQPIITVCGHSDLVTSLWYLEKEDVFITCSLDASLRIWSKKNDMYWPCAWETLHSPSYTAAYWQEGRLLWVGLANGCMLTFKVNPDFNGMQYEGNFMGHNDLVTCMIFDKNEKIVISGGKDGVVNVYNVDTKASCGFAKLSSAVVSVTYDATLKYAFAGTATGEIALIKCSNRGISVGKTISAHAGEVKCLLWDKSKQILYSGGQDGRITMFNFGSAAMGIQYELNKHAGSVKSLMFKPIRSNDNNNNNNQWLLLSHGNDGDLVTWNLNRKIIMCPEWRESDTCEICREPFFWAYKIKFNTNRQRHCRKCGRALCKNCCPHKSRYCIAGYENMERMCIECYPKLQPSETNPMSKSYAMHGIAFMKQVSATSNKILIANKDFSFRLYQID